MVEDIYICICFQDPVDEACLCCKDGKTDEKGDEGGHVANREGNLLDHSQISRISQISRLRKVHVCTLDIYLC